MPTTSQAAHLVAGQHVDETLLLGAAKDGGGVRFADVGVEHVRIELRHHIPAHPQKCTVIWLLDRKPGCTGWAAWPP